VPEEDISVSTYCVHNDLLQWLWDLKHS